MPLPARQTHEQIATATPAGARVAIDVAVMDAVGNQITSFGGGGNTIGAAVPATASAIAVEDNLGNLAYPHVDASGNLLCQITGAGSGGTSSVDGAAFTAGTSAGTAIIGVKNDTAPAQLAEGKQGIARLTAFRAIHENIRDNAGNEIITTLDYDSGAGTTVQGIVGIALPASGGPVAGGTSANPLRVDPTGTTAQPVTNAGTFAVQAAVSQPTAASATTASVAASAASVTLLASNAARKFAIIYNDSTVNLFIIFGATASTSSFSYLLGPSQTWEMSPAVIYTGVIAGIWASATGNARTTEL